MKEVYQFSPKISGSLDICKAEMTSAAVRVGGAATHAAMAMSGILSKIGVLAKHEMSKSSAKAPTFLVVHGLSLV